MNTIREIPRTMRAAILYDADDIRIEQRPVPVLEAGDMLVQTGASGICSGDLMAWYVKRKAPFIFGHEPAGTVVAVASDDVKWTAMLGRRVFAHHHVPCFACALCERGDYVQCASWRSSSLDPGAMAEFFRVPASNLAEIAPISPGMSFVAGSLIEPLACVVKSLSRGGVPLQDITRFEDLAQRFRERSVYVVGLGVMGLMHVSVAVAAGARTFGSDFLAQRRALAQVLGAEVFEPGAALAAVSSAWGGGPDIVVCGPGNATALQHAVDAVRPGGTVVMFTPFEPLTRFEFDQSAAYFRDLRLIASYSCGPDDTSTAVKLLEMKIVEPERLGVTTAPFDGVVDLYREMREAKIVKGVVVFGEPAQPSAD